MTATWDIIVTVDGTDISTQLVDTSPISVEANRSAARIAEFTVVLSGVINPNDWVGKAVTIDYVAGATTRLFNGVISEPTLSIADKTLRCTCTDDLQRIADGKSHAELMTLTGAYYSDLVLNDEAIGWERLQDMLTTVAKHVYLDTAGVLQCISAQNAVSPDYTFTEADIIDESLSVKLAQRSNLINRVDLTFSARFERLLHRAENLFWSWPLNFCETWYYKIRILYKQLIVDAVKKSGWTLTAESYTPSWLTDIYHCPEYGPGADPIIYNNISPDELINGFNIDAARRWQQAVTVDFGITITAPDSIAAYGELAQGFKTSASFEPATIDWGVEGTEFTTLPPGFAYDANGNQFYDDIDTAALQNAIDCLIAIGIERINSSHRSNTVSFAVPLNPAINLPHTVKVDDSNVVAKGIVNRIRHTLELDTARAVTEVDLLLSSGQSGLDTVTPSWTTPTLPDNSDPSPPILSTQVPTHIGRSFNSQTDDPVGTLWGVLLNRSFPEDIAGVTPDPVIVYEERVDLKFGPVDPTNTDNINVPQPVTIQVDVPDNLLTVTA